MTPKRILWLDDDPMVPEPYLDALSRAGFFVRPIQSLLAAEQVLRDEPFDLLILDVMIPTLNKEEEEEYPPEQTERGLKNGLWFYRRMKPLLQEKQIPVLVCTIRIFDLDLVSEFTQEGLPSRNVSNRYQLRKPERLVRMVRTLLQPHGMPQDNSGGC